MIRQLKFVPSVCQERKIEVKLEKKGRVEVKTLPPTFEGYVVLSAPNYKQRVSYMKLLKFTADAQGQIETLSMTDKMEVADSLANVVIASQGHYLEVNLKRLSDGQEFKSFDDLDFDPAGAEILQECANLLMQGFTASKN